MKITEEYNDFQSELLAIVSAEYTGEYTIRLIFSDSKSHIVDFEPFLRSSFHPSIRKYLEINLFRQYKIVDGNLNWNEYDLIFPLNDLYQGGI